jgi:hypothetical protein
MGNLAYRMIPIGLVDGLSKMGDNASYVITRDHRKWEEEIC